MLVRCRYTVVTGASGMAVNFLIYLPLVGMYIGFAYALATITAVLNNFIWINLFTWMHLKPVFSCFPILPFTSPGTAAELGFGIYLSVISHLVYYDAVSRVANAFYVFYSRDLHLGATGFVWNPLPNLLELGPLLLWPLVQYGANGMSEAMVSFFSCEL